MSIVDRTGVEFDIGSGHGASGNVQFVSGTTSTKLNFGEIVGDAMTICSLSRYTHSTDANTYGRILNGAGSLNWFHGHYARSVGTSFTNPIKLGVREFLFNNPTHNS